MSEKFFINPDFMERCSEKTLQTNKQGFFLQLCDVVAEAAGKQWINNVFGKLKSDRERIRIIYQHKPIRDVLVERLSYVQEVYSKKSAEFSQKRRLDSELLINKDDLKKKLILCSQAVLRAPLVGENHTVDDGFTLTLAYWTRAKVLMEMEKYSLALEDIRAAQKENLDDSLKAEAFFKMAICYKALGEESRANVALKLAEKFSKEHGTGNFCLEALPELKYDKNSSQENRVLPEITDGENPNLLNGSNKLDLKEEQDKGRYIVAKKPIQTGDVVAVEKPCVSCLLPDSYSTNCLHCFEKLVSPVGCHVCSNVAFCKAECRNRALESYHGYECRFVNLLVGSGMSILCHTALRMITQKHLNENMSLYDNKENESIFSLCTNAHLRPPLDMFQRSIMVAFLLRCLQKSGYFADSEANSSVVPNEEELRIAEMILVYIQILQFNAHEIYETHFNSKHRFQTTKTVYIGIGLYQTASFFNHDCYPAVTRYFVGKSMILTATRPLKKDDIVAENYGPIFTRKALSARQISLNSRYWFKCKCEACTKEWPTFQTGLEKCSKVIRCLNEKCSNTFTLPVKNALVTCPKCRKKIDLSNRILNLKLIEEQYDKASRAILDDQDPVKAINLLQVAIDSFHIISKPPHYFTHLSQELLTSCLADFGNKYLIE